VQNGINIKKEGETMPYCPKCGGEIVGDDSPCSYCGQKVGNVQASIQKPIVISEITDSEMTDSDKHPISGYISIVLTGIGLIMIIIFVSLGMNQTGDAGWSMFAIGFLFLSMTLATVGMFSGFIGLNHPKKTLSWIGLTIAGIFVTILAVIIIKS